MIQCRICGCKFDEKNVKPCGCSCAFGGCHGNTTGVAALAKGLPIDEVIDKLSGIQCGFRGTSCPDQLSKALIAYKENN